jgi:hypothetical protein
MHELVIRQAQVIELLAEISIALAGFAGIFATNQFRSAGKFYLWLVCRLPQIFCAKRY